ncbi:hypothetical protein HD554DRAFT_2144689 [Boletus coccyginus]|nr:hypothetical protein HD554DRAFT_2144689 [Boletus coccyginus]
MTMPARQHHHHTPMLSLTWYHHHRRSSPRSTSVTSTSPTLTATAWQHPHPHNDSNHRQPLPSLQRHVITTMMQLQGTITTSTSSGNIDIVGKKYNMIFFSTSMYYLNNMIQVYMFWNCAPGCWKVHLDPHTTGTKNAVKQKKRGARRRSAVRGGQKTRWE